MSQNLRVPSKCPEQMMCSSLVQRTELQLLWQMMVRTQKPLLRSHTLMHLSVPLLTARRELLGLQSTLLTCKEERENLLQWQGGMLSHSEK